MNKIYFITGIGTHVGKTLVSALLCEYLKADYFKPIQTGYPPDRDSEWVSNMVSFPIVIHKENYLLAQPASPHLAAKREGVEIDENKLILPNTENYLIIEGAGGILVPINNDWYIIDLVHHFGAECILVVSNYLGCINHALLSLHYIFSKNIPFKGVVMNGNFDEEVYDAITKNLLPSQVISRISYYEMLNQSTFQIAMNEFKDNLNAAL